MRALGGYMRLRAYGCAAALTTLALVGCDNTPQVDNISPKPDTTSTAGSARQSDALITTQIQSKYFVSPDVKAHRVDVDTNQGVVTLEGTVDRDSERQAA